MAKSTQRKGQAARASKAVDRKNNQNNAMEPVAHAKKKVAGSTVNQQLPKAGRRMENLPDPSAMADAMKLYSQRQSIDSMRWVIENETGRSMEDKIKQLEYVNRLEGEAKREAHGQVIEGALEIVGAFFLTLCGAGWLNKKGFIKLPPISIF
ncbi:MAG: hypothetical protein IJ089_01945 [Clostridia bacterium]|nr:hypothetical protein [Clostridia bacterium]